MKTSIWKGEYETRQANYFWNYRIYPFLWSSWKSIVFSCYIQSFCQTRAANNDRSKSKTKRCQSKTRTRNCFRWPPRVPSMYSRLFPRKRTATSHLNGLAMLREHSVDGASQRVNHRPAIFGGERKLRIRRDCLRHAYR